MDGEEDEEDESDEDDDEEEESEYEEEDEEGEQVQVIIVRSEAKRMRRRRERIAAPSQAKSCDHIPWQRKRPRCCNPWKETQEFVGVAGGTACASLFGGFSIVKFPSSIATQRQLIVTNYMNDHLNS